MGHYNVTGYHKVSTAFNFNFKNNAAKVIQKNARLWLKKQKEEKERKDKGRRSTKL